MTSRRSRAGRGSSVSKRYSRGQIAEGRNITYHVLVVLMEVNASLLSNLPLLGDRAVDVGLVDDLGDDLRPVLQEVGARGGDLGAVDGICRPVLEQQRDQRAEGIEEEGDDDEVDHEERDGSSPHDGGGEGGGGDC